MKSIRQMTVRELESLTPNQLDRLSEAEKDAVERRLGTQPLPELPRLREAEDDILDAVPQLQSLIAEGVGPLGIRWLRNLVGQAGWKQLGLDRRLRVGNCDSNVDALVDVARFLDRELATIDMLGRGVSRYLAKRTLCQLEAWWNNPKLHKREIGMAAILAAEPNLAEIWDTAKVSRRIELLATALDAIDQHDREEKKAAAEAREREATLGTPPFRLSAEAVA